MFLYAFEKPERARIDKVNGHAELAETSRASDTMQIGLVVGWVFAVRLGQVEVDHQIDVLDVDAARAHVRRHEHFAFALAESLNHAGALKHVQLGREQLARHTVFTQANDEIFRYSTCLLTEIK